MIDTEYTFCGEVSKKSLKALAEMFTKAAEGLKEE